MRVGLFDSGIGGVNVLSELIKKYPHNHYIYFGDTKNLPYGNKSKDELINLSSKIIDFLVSKKVDIIIIACGTVSSNCYYELKQKYNIPIYDIITPTLNFLKKSHYNKIGVIATTRTIESKIFNIEKKDIIMKDTPTFVPIIENNLIKEKKDEIINELNYFKKEKIEALVLGCTHYPLLSDVIKKNMDIPLINMGTCLLDVLNLNNKDELKIELYFSKLNDNIRKNIKVILDNNYSIEKI